MRHAYTGRKAHRCYGNRFCYGHDATGRLLAVWNLGFLVLALGLWVLQALGMKF